MRLLLAALFLLAPAVARAGAIKVEAPVLRASLGASPNTAGYLTLVNAGDRPDRLMSVRCACARAVAIHRTEMAHGMARMADAAILTIPPHSQVTLRPEGLHLMVMGLKRPLATGERQPMTLVFERAGPTQAVFLVRGVIETPAAAAMDSMPGMAH